MWAGGVKLFTWCTAFSCHGANLPHSSPYTVWFRFVAKSVWITHQFCICCWTVLTQYQGLFSLSHCLYFPQGFNKRLGEDTAGTSDPSWPKSYSSPYNVSLSDKTVGRGLQSSVALGLTWHWMVSCITWFLFVCWLFFLLFPLATFTFDPQAFSLLPFQSSPLSRWGPVNKWIGEVWPASWGQPTTPG